MYPRQIVLMKRRNPYYPSKEQARKRRMLTKVGPRQASGLFYRNPVAITPGYTRTVGAYGRAAPGSIEKKYLDSEITNTGDNSARTVTDSICKIPQGTTDVTRVGNKVNITNINLNVYLQQDDQSTGTYSNGWCRVILYQDKQANGATAAVLDILKTAVIGSYRNLDQVDRFVILKDKEYSVGTTSANALHTQQTIRRLKISKKCNIPIHYSATLGAITEFKSNNIGVLVIAHNSLTNFTANVRVKYTDL
nr:MAG TPA: capsid protein [Cressdnaviricota sp.]